MKSVIPDSDPLWYKDAIIYELHVKAFFDSNGDGIGDFPGLMQKLDYLQSLGVTCVWLLPFYPSPLRDDGYDIADYRGVHPSYGNRRDFRQFVEEAHRRGLRVITELVINHTSDQHPWFQAARAAPSGTSKRDFYVWSDSPEKYRDARIIFTDSEPSNWTWDPVAKAYFWHRFFHHQPDLNFENPLVLRAVQRVMDFWLEMGVDGLRLDAIPYLAERDGTSCENLPETHRILQEIRRHLDQHHRGKMLLAEANQWPDDVRPYFSDGDECHMAYHFPLMPRIFMALSQEDRHPITEIMWRTPQIPSSCQWALFLRNHDELTLEMVTDEERDYMYYAYAADPRMRINIGIRRRLAPLMENDRRRIELLNSLLFSFPGTPIVYYGDEIGMGDNVYLGDRNGVRTPMQWTGDRNAGFSRADFEKLYSPPILHPVYGYQAVNVEAQERDPSSLLNWMKQIIALRKRSHIFGRGDIRFLAPKNRKILAYLRQYGGETVLCVANLSRLSQPVELDLAEFSGMVPIEMAGRTEFPPIAEKPYFLSLNPYSFFWFEFQRRRETGAISALAPLPEGATLDTIEFEGQWDSLLRPSSRDRLEGSILPGFLARQRWFGSKARSIREVRISDSALLNSSAHQAAFLILCEVGYEDGEHETYLTPLKVLTGQAADDVLRDSPGAVLAQAIGPAGHGVLVDALVDDAFCQFMLAAVASRREIGTRLGRVRGDRYAPFDEAHKSGSDPLPVFRSSAEQSNSNIIYGNRLILKLFRKVEPGPNPDFEITHFLTDRTDFRRVPQTAGVIEYAPRGGKPATLAMLQVLVPNQGSAWDHALDELERYFERAMAGQAIPPEVAESGRKSLLDLAFEPEPAWVDEIVGSYLGSAALLGERTAELHLALSEDWEDPAFSPELFTESDFEHLLDDVRGRTRSALATLAQVVDRLGPGRIEHARQLLALRPALEARLEDFARSEVVADKIRCHGDYHLGQVLWAESDFVILDFEGEPARRIAERRAKQSALKDVAGMIRSFGYAAYAALFKFTERRPEDLERLESWALLWQQRVAARYLRAYRERAGKASFVPAESDQFSDLLEIFVLEKAVYELQYEMNNRPDWILIPIRGIISLIEGASPR